jgi:hypothetical protein
MSVLSGARKALRDAGVSAQVSYYRVFKRRTLDFQGRTYRYFYNSYNPTFTNERVIEVPIVWDEVQRHAPDQVLEVGNVLAHYFPIQHQVLDKYERARGVINADVVDFQPQRRYELIAASSTLEHVGWDETPREPEKFLRAVSHLATLLAPGGTLLVTLPVGYNAAVDHFLAEGMIPFTSVGYLKRDEFGGRWREVAGWNDVAGTVYLHGRRTNIGTWIPGTAQALAVGRIVRK